MADDVNKVDVSPTLTVSSLGTPTIAETRDPKVGMRDVETRSSLAIVLTLIFAGTIALAFILAWRVLWLTPVPTYPSSLTPTSQAPQSKVKGAPAHTSAPQADPAKLAQAQADLMKQEEAIHVDEAQKLFGLIKDLLTVLLPAETGLLSAAFGFYFGVKTGEQQKT